MDEFIMESHKYNNNELVKFEDNTMKVVSVIVILELLFICCFMFCNCCAARYGYRYANRY